MFAALLSDGRFEYLEPKHAEALAVAADILSKRAPSSPLSPPSPSPARAPAAARHLDEDLIGGVGPQPTPAAPRHARQYEAKAAEWLSTWDLDWLDMPTGPISDPASDLADEVRCFSSLRARTVKVGGSSSSKRLMGKDLDDLDKAFQHADAHVVSPLVNEGASAAVKVDRAAEAALRRVIRHQQVRL